jgi:ABC-type Zn uptake system ZnuABC Zn-binding protein ZnuA
MTNPSPSQSPLQTPRGPRSRVIGGILVAAVLLAGALLAGCGSSSSTSSSSSASTASSAPKLTKAEFVAKANAICAKGNTVGEAAAAKLGKTPSQAQIIAYVKSTEVPAIQGQITGILALGAPSGEEATIKHIMALAQADLNRVKANPNLFTSNVNVFADFSKLAHPYGLTACAKG